MANGIAARHLLPGSKLHTMRWQYLYREPTAVNNSIVNAFSLTGVSAGQLLTLTASPVWLGAATGITFTQNDAAGTTLAVTYRVRGINILWQSVSEDVSLTHSAASSVTNTLNAWVRVDSIEVVSIANNAASDTISVGIDPNTAKTGSQNDFRVGMPVKMTAVGQVIAYNPAAQNTVTLSNLDTTRQTVSYASTGTGRIFLFIFDPTVNANL